MYFTFTLLLTIEWYSPRKILFSQQAMQLNFSKIILGSGILFVLSLLTVSCRKETVFSSSPVQLQLSTDSVLFDTLFTRLGNNPHLPKSITFQVRVTNPTSEAVKTDIAFSGNETGTAFLMNVDGAPGKQFSQVEIPAKDSIFIFMQVYPDSITQFSNDLPFPITDYLQFNTNGSHQQVVLFGFGQNSHFLQDSVLPAANITWNADRPYVIYNSILVPEGGTLTINEGVQVHSYVNSTIYVAGTLIVNGSCDNPVVFKGSRLDPDYRDEPGQWNGIHILTGSKNNSIRSATFQNGFYGIRSDSSSVNANPKLFIEKCTFKHMSAAGVVAFSSDVKMLNTLMYDCGLYTFVADLGGHYILQNNTLIAPYSTVGRGDPSCIVSNAPLRDSLDHIIAKFELSYEITNCIITGGLDDEFSLPEDSEGLPVVNKLIRNNVLKTTETTKFSGNNNQLNIDPQFVDVYHDNYELSGNSPCNKAGVDVNILSDLRCRSRNFPPCIGALEVQK